MLKGESRNTIGRVLVRDPAATWTTRCSGITKTHKSSSRLYGGAKRLLGQTAAAINLNSHVETRHLAFHAR